MIGIMADGNQMIGMGHFVRCSGIADILTAYEKSVIFLISADSDSSFFGMRKDGYYQLKIKTKSGWCIDEVSDVIRELGITTLIIDSYRVTQEAFSILRSVSKLVYIDDLDMYDCDTDILINFNFLVDKKKYLQSHIRNRLLYTGIQYYPLRREFMGKRKQAIEKSVRTVLVTSSSTDPYKCVLQIVSAINPAEFPDIKFQVLLGRFYSEEYKTELKERLSAYGNVDFILWGEQIAYVIASSDLVISPGSSMIVEALSVNTPCISYQFVDNHHPFCVQLEEMGIADFIGIFPNQSLDKRIKSLFSDELKFEKRENQSKIYSSLFDGRGLERIAEILM